jgi:hypothetical protein
VLGLPSPVLCAMILSWLVYYRLRRCLHLRHSPQHSLVLDPLPAGLPSSPTSCRACDQAARLLSGFHKGRGRRPGAGSRCPGMQRQGSGADLASPQFAPLDIAIPPRGGGQGKLTG